MPEIISVNFPDIGEGVVEGEVIQWLKNVNDLVEEHEPVVVVMTDKATVELPSPYVGKLIKQHYREGETAIKDRPLYDIEVATAASVSISNSMATPSPPATDSLHKIPLEQLKKKQSTESEPVISAPLTRSGGEKGLAIPATRRLAKDLNVSLGEIAGSGPNGRVMKEDVIQHHANMQSVTVVKHSNRAAPAIHTSTPVLHWEDDEEFPLRGLRNMMAERMVESKLIIPHFSYFDQVDATRLIQMRDKMKQEASAEGISLTYMPFFIRALSRTIKQYPIFNGSIDLTDRTLVVHKHHNIGIAFKTSAGLLVPVLKNVQEMTLSEVIRSYERLKMKAVSGKLEPIDMKEATITISNFGTLGGLWATPIINYPEVAIMGVAKIHKEPVVINETVVVRDMLNLSWSFDHRIIDGDAAAQFSNFFINLIKNPAALL